MTALELIKSMDGKHPNGYSIKVIERIGFAEERTPVMVHSTKQALEGPAITPCWYLEIWMEKDGKQFCTHRKSWVNPKGGLKATDEEKEGVAKQILLEMMMGGISSSYFFVRNHLSNRPNWIGWAIVNIISPQ